jgi:NADH:ubiquinone oxidoreductase subunit E
MEQQHTEPDEFAELFREFAGTENELISILVRVQEHFGFVSEEAIRRISMFLRISENSIYGVASFFSKFRFDEPGRTSIRICMGTACHVHGGGYLAGVASWHLGMQIGKTMKDKSIDFQRVNCLGCCALAPVIQVGGGIHPRTMVTGLKEILDNRE